MTRSLSKPCACLYSALSSRNRPSRTGATTSMYGLSCSSPKHSPARSRNTEGAKAGETVVTANGVKILGFTNLPGRIAADSSALYARNLVAFSELFKTKEGAFAPDLEDEILKASLVTHGGAVVHPSLQA